MGLGIDLSFGLARSLRIPVTECFQRLLGIAVNIVSVQMARSIPSNRRDKPRLMRIGEISRSRSRPQRQNPPERVGSVVYAFHENQRAFSRSGCGFRIRPSSKNASVRAPRRTLRARREGVWPSSEDVICVLPDIVDRRQQPDVQSFARRNINGYGCRVQVRRLVDLVSSRRDCRNPEAVRGHSCAGRSR